MTTAEANAVSVLETRENAAHPMRKGRRYGWLLPAAIVGAVLVVALLLLPREGGRIVGAGMTTVPVARGTLEIVVLEGGSVKALDSLELKSQVEAREGTKILTIVEEGTEIGPEDVESGKILVRLDPTEMKNRIEVHDIEFENAQSALTEANEARAIQAVVSENEVNDARQAARFALLDLDKYLGKEISAQVLSQRSLPSDEASLLSYEEDYRQRLMGVEGSAAKEGAAGEEIIGRRNWVRVDFAEILEKDRLGDGEAQLEMRKRQGELLVAQSEYAVQQESILASERLSEKDFITRATLDKERVALKKAEVAELSARTQLELYRQYEFPKRAEELLTKYTDSLNTLDRKKTEALSKLNQTEARLRNAEQMARMAQRKREELAEQLESCTIVATKPGLVVYGSGERNRSFGGSEEKIAEGASVRFKQTIITIPDMRQMGVTVSIRESHIKKIAIGQTVRIVIDAEPDRVLSGEVKKVAVVPDSTRWFDNPNQKIYPCEIHIEGTHDWLKPGMSAKVEIVTDLLRDVLQIPLQAVMVDAGETVVFVKRRGNPVRQAVKTGGFNDAFIEILSGIQEGEPVYLSKPEGTRGAEGMENGVASS